MLGGETGDVDKVNRNLLRSIATRLRRPIERGTDYDRQTVAVMERVLQPASNCVDVGASRGELLKHMVRLAPQGTHLAFEPLPQFYDALIRKFPGVRVYDLALSDTTGECSFQHVVTNPAYSGLRRRRYDRLDERVEEIRVRTDRLDNIVPRNLTPQFLKIDVEGGEFLVLNGAAETIRRHRPFIVFEFGEGAADWYGVEPEQMYGTLAGWGLDLSLMPAWLSGGRSLSEREFAAEFRECRNCYFLAHPCR